MELISPAEVTVAIVAGLLTVLIHLAFGTDLESGKIKHFTTFGFLLIAGIVTWNILVSILALVICYITALVIAHGQDNGPPGPFDFR